MDRLVECVPNFSEGRSTETVDALVAAAQREGATLLDREMDASHNRCVITFAGAPDVVARAAFAAVREAIPRIDLNRHKGEHPRMGACDVIPFVPIAGVTIDEAVQLAADVGARIGAELQIPVYLYAEAARRPERRALPDVRKGEFEGLRDAIGKDPAKAPDFGPNRIHPTAGATAVGARFFLIAYNVQLETADVEVAKAIAHEIRERDGGLPRVQAKGFEVDVDGKKLAQVSMNLLDFRQTSIQRAFEEVERRAKQRGAAIVDSELVGLVPRAALDDATARRVRLRGYDPSKQVLEEVIAARSGRK
jgi:glutamate formiminotransferase